jgi:chromosome segregation ATPase
MIVSDISFLCPHCAGPLITEAAHSGMQTDCPHCFHVIQVPEGETIDKSKFIEPIGLRRTLKEVRDQEWEIHRRKLREALKRNQELEAALATDSPAAALVDEEVQAECEALRKELSTAWEELAATRQELVLSREEYGAQLEELRAEQAAFHAELERLRSAREKAEAEAAKLRESVAILTTRLKEESAKVFIMEAAINSDISYGVASPADVLKLQQEVADLRKRNYALQQSRDGAKEELARIRQANAEVPEDRLNQTLATLTSGLTDSRLTARQSN